MFITGKIHRIFITEREQICPIKMMFQEYTLKICLFKKKNRKPTHTQKNHPTKKSHQPPKPQQQKPNPNNPKMKKKKKKSQVFTLLICFQEHTCRIFCTYSCIPLHLLLPDSVLDLSKDEHFAN